MGNYLLLKNELNYMMRNNELDIGQLQIVTLVSSKKYIKLTYTKKNNNSLGKRYFIKKTSIENGYSYIEKDFSILSSTA